MDNFHFDVTGELQSDIESAFKILTRNGRRKAIGYKVVEKMLEKVSRPGFARDIPARVDKILMFYWVKADGVQILPFELDAAGLVDFTIRWLKVNPPQRPEPDHDGDNGHGFRIYNEAWGRVHGEYQAFAAVHPEWSCYGK